MRPLQYAVNQSQIKNIPILFYFLDAEKAFDIIEWAKANLGDRTKRKHNEIRLGYYKEIPSVFFNNTEVRENINSCMDGTFHSEAIKNMP